MNQDQKVKFAADNLLKSVYGYFGLNQENIKQVDWLDLVAATQRMNHTLIDYDKDPCLCTGCERFFGKIE